MLSKLEGERCIPEGPNGVVWEETTADRFPTVATAEVFVDTVVDAEVVERDRSATPAGVKVRKNAPLARLLETTIVTPSRTPAMAPKANLPRLIPVYLTVPQ